ncbi:MAG: type II toxin-antitoxin system RelE/ParE family toxin [Elusimicrobia bacterium]|nr:type II toxin-antitoxin system RelE/ParE family toxin [Elusimicrobiota bacterium]
MKKISAVYRTAAGAEPYSDYVNSLRDREGAAKIRVRVTRAELGNLGDHKNIGRGIIELRIDYGPGYRVYVGLHGLELIVLLCAGAKCSQREDVRRAMAFWEDYKRNL